ncbi:MAG: bacterioferritin [Acidobacteria bacterium]|nr:bacterioferritin [Acidobacteriota bacterium]
MQGNPKVITALNEALREELLAINQYFIHAMMCEDWGYLHLAKEIRKASIEEMRHAESLMQRILFLEGTPNLTRPMELAVGATVKAQFESDLKLELGSVESYNRFVRIAKEEGDNGSRDLFESLLKAEEAHVDYLEAQLVQIDQMGLENYLAYQLKDGD